jgi:CheY-like chemotaxis protein
VQSAVGEGSAFIVTVPLSRTRSLADYDQRALEALGGLAGEDEQGGLSAGLRVLLAEDHPVNQRVVQLILGEYGIEVVTVENGADAVTAFNLDRYDLILMDMQMPVMDGLAATRAIRAIEAGSPDRAATPIVMLSANAMDQHLAETEAAGADRHLAKPFTPPALIQVVSDLTTHVEMGEKIAVNGA